VINGYAIFITFPIWGIDMTAWLASAGIVGIAVGFAAKDTLANLFSGFFILADTPYRLYDYINLDGGDRGMVTHIGMRSTRILTRDDIEITIPNAVIANAKIINESGGPRRKIRLRIAVSVSYESDVDQVTDVLSAIAVSNQSVIQIPEPRVRLRGFGSSSLDFELLCWIENPENRGLVSHELYMTIFKIFNENDIVIPFNQQDITIKNLPSRYEKED
jgi:small-conductance mechanosensitive channel